MKKLAIALLVFVLAASLATPASARHKKNPNPEARAAEKRGKARQKEAKKAAKAVHKQQKAQQKKR